MSKVCVHVCMSGCVCICVCIYMLVEVRGQYWESLTIHLIFKEHGSVNLQLTDWVTQQVLGSPLPASLELGLEAHTAIPCPLCPFRGRRQILML